MRCKRENCGGLMRQCNFVDYENVGSMEEPGWICASCGIAKYLNPGSSVIIRTNCRYGWHNDKRKKH